MSNKNDEIEDTLKKLESQLNNLKNKEKINFYTQKMNDLLDSLDKESDTKNQKKSNVIQGDFQFHRYSDNDIKEFYNSTVEHIHENASGLPLPTLLGIFKVIEFSLIMNTMSAIEEEMYDDDDN